MRKMLTLLVCLLAIASVFISCAAEQVGDMATVRISVDSERSRSIAPEGGTTVNEVKTYRFSFVQDGNAEFTFDFEKSENTTGVYNMTGIKPGKYTLLAEAINSDGKTVATCTLENEDLRRGTNSFNVSFTAFDTDATGNVSINVKFKPGEYTGTVTITGSIRKLDESGKDYTLTNGTVGSDGFINATGVVTDLPIGSYRLSIEGRVNTKVMFALNEVVIVAEDKTTVVNHTFSENTAVTTITVTDTLVTPLTGTLSVEKGSSYGDVKMTLNIDGGLPESIYKDEEGNTRNVIITWFMEEYYFEGTTVTYNPSGMTINYNVSAFFGPANYSVYFYLDGYNESLGSCELRANCDIGTGDISPVDF